MTTSWALEGAAQIVQTRLTSASRRLIYAQHCGRLNPSRLADPPSRCSPICYVHLAKCGSKHKLLLRDRHHDQSFCSVFYLHRIHRSIGSAHYRVRLVASANPALLDSTSFPLLSGEELCRELFSFLDGLLASPISTYLSNERCRFGR